MAEVGFSTLAGESAGASVCAETIPKTVALATAVPSTMLAMAPIKLLPTLNTLPRFGETVAAHSHHRGIANGSLSARPRNPDHPHGGPHQPGEQHGDHPRA